VRQMPDWQVREFARVPIYFRDRKYFLRQKLAGQKPYAARYVLEPWPAEGAQTTNAWLSYDDETVAQREAEAFGPLIKRVQEELDATLIVVEHDLPLIMSISDRVYCLEAGTVIAVGSPDEVRADPRVIASYLGTDERAIQRSNA